ncbi:MAG TPA: hypothetical protein VK581_07955, partial [Chthoniobacterales bacterium]|nr:hypothetical protein [Chthoniobacterales bacterium]
MTADLEINNSANPRARYVTWFPSPCRIRLTDASGATAPVSVTLTGRSTATGGVVRFRRTQSGAAATSLSLQLPIN